MLRLHVLLSLILATILVVATGGPSAFAQETDHTADDRHPLVGSWLLFVDDDPTAPTNAPALVAFTADGIYIQADPDGRNGFGTWESLGPDTAGLTFAFSGPGEGGAFAGLVLGRVFIQVGPDGETFVAPYEIAVIGPDGSVLQVVPGIARGTRIIGQPIEDLAGMDAMGTPVATPAGDAAEAAATPTTGGPQPATPEAAAGEAEAAVTVETHSFFFAPEEFEIPVGTQLTVTNPSDVEHSFTVDELGINVEVHPGETKTITVNAESGQHEFYCEYHPDRMRGTMTVV